MIIIKYDVMMCMILFFYLAIAGMGCGLILHPKIGITQPGKCLAYGYNYNIRDYITTSSSNATNLILYEGTDYSCIDNKYIQSCEALRTDPILQLSADLFTQQFKAGDGLLFPYFLLVIFTLIAHLILVGFRMIMAMYWIYRYDGIYMHIQTWRQDLY